MTFPSEYGLSFSAFRPLQTRALARMRRAFESSRIVGLQAGTGFGKSAVGQAAVIEASAVALDDESGEGRTAVVTATHPLADQYGAELLDYDHETPGALPFLDIRGRNNYACPDHGTCEEGRYRRCPRQRGEDITCPYIVRYSQAMGTSIITNFRYFLEIQRRPATGGLGVFDRIVFDEAHHLLDILTSAAAVTLTPRDVDELAVRSRPKSIAEWAAVARRRLPAVAASLSEARRDGAVRLVKHLEGQVDKLDKLSGATEDNWALDENAEGVRKFEPIDASRFSWWFLDAADEILLMSATLRPMTLKLLGLDPSDYRLIEMGSDFSPDDAPVYCMPDVQVRYTMTDADKRVLSSRIDQFISDRPDRKGVIHTVSYRNAEMLRAGSPHADRMILHERGGKNIAAAVRRFREAPPGAVLVSPSVDTGYDFPGDAADWQVILKLPWPDNRGSENLMKARKERFPMFSEFGVCQKLEQMAGRINRGRGERGETIIFDKMAQWFVPKFGAKGLFTPHFMKRWRFVEGPFPPMPMDLKR